MSRLRRVMWVIFAAGLCGLAAPAADAPRPLAPVWQDEENSKISLADVERLLAQLKSERVLLDADWKSLTKRLESSKGAADTSVVDLQERLKQVLQRLQRDPVEPKTAPEPVRPKLVTPPEDPSKVVHEAPHTPPTPSVVDANTGSVDLLKLAQTLFRAERYEESLAAFDKIDLKARSAAERTPIILMKAACLHQLGKTDDAINKLREAANARGDEQIAGYAQWQLDMLRWHREIRAKLEDIRQRRTALEKRP